MNTEATIAASIPLPDWLPDDPYLHALIREQHGKMLPHGGGMVNPERAAYHLAQLAKRAYEWGRHEAIHDLLTSAQVAAELGISRITLTARAGRDGIGWHIGRDYLFRREDVELLRRAKPGRPRKAATPVD